MKKRVSGVDYLWLVCPRCHQSPSHNCHRCRGAGGWYKSLAHVAGFITQKKRKLFPFSP
jgi:hypothetical protein